MSNLASALDFQLKDGILQPQVTSTPVLIKEDPRGTLDTMNHIRRSMDGLGNNGVMTFNPESKIRVYLLFTCMLERASQILCAGNKLLPTEDYTNTRDYRRAMRSFLEDNGRLEYKASSNANFIIADRVHVLLERNGGIMALFNDSGRCEQLIKTFDSIE